MVDRHHGRRGVERVLASLPEMSAPTFPAIVPSRLSEKYGRHHDLQGDPEEVRNLFDASEAASVQRKFKSLLTRRPDDAGPIRTPVGIA